MTAPPPLLPAPPAFSRRLYFGPVHWPDGRMTEPPEGTLIYVEARRSTYAEDWGVELSAWRERRSFMAMCFGPSVPEGEIGFVRLSDVVEIPEAEFRGAVQALRSAAYPGQAP